MPAAYGQLQASMSHSRDVIAPFQAEQGSGVKTILKVSAEQAVATEHPKLSIFEIPRIANCEKSFDRRHWLTLTSATLTRTFRYLGMQVYFFEDRRRVLLRSIVVAYKGKGRGPKELAKKGIGYAAEEQVVLEAGSARATSRFNCRFARLGLPQSATPQRNPAQCEPPRTGNGSFSSVRRSWHVKDTVGSGFAPVGKGRRSRYDPLRPLRQKSLDGGSAEGALRSKGGTVHPPFGLGPAEGGMLIPMPPVALGGYSSYAKSRQTTILCLLILQTVVILSRWVFLLDILGGFIMAIATGFGWYAYKEEMHGTFLCYWGMMCFINGVFDFVKFIDFWVHSPFPLFSDNLPFSSNLRSLILILVPAVTLPAAVIAWYVYKDAENGEGGYEDRSNERAPLRGSNGAGSGPGLLSGSSFQAFGGQGQRLGAA
eukprot:s5482_g3.t1